MTATEPRFDPWSSKPFSEWTIADGLAAWHNEDTCQRDAHGCVCPCHLPLPNRAEAQAEAGIDVLILAAALDNIDRDYEQGWTPAHYARGIATEYARLAAEVDR